MYIYTIIFEKKTVHGNRMGVKMALKNVSYDVIRQHRLAKIAYYAAPSCTKFIFPLHFNRT